MKHIAAYLLLTVGGNSSPSAADVKALLDTVGVEADSDRLEKLISELEGKDIASVSAARGAEGTTRAGPSGEQAAVRGEAGSVAQRRSHGQGRDAVPCVTTLAQPSHRWCRRDLLRSAC